MALQNGVPYAQDDILYDYEMRALAESYANQPLPEPRSATPPLPEKRPATTPNQHHGHQFNSKIGNSVARIINSIGMESFWPSTMDRECQKAARILTSFATNDLPQGLKIILGPCHGSGPRRRRKAWYTIPPSELQEAYGLVIFTVARSGGLFVAPQAGSGIIVSRLPDGSWSPPAALTIGSMNFSFAPCSWGLDIAEAVLVFRSPEAVAGFKASCRYSFGVGGHLTLGFWGAGEGVEMLSNMGLEDQGAKLYTRSRGLFISLAFEGRFASARKAAMELFYGVEGITVDDILCGNVPAEGPKGMWPEGARTLMQVLRAEAGPCNWGKVASQSEGQFESQAAHNVGVAGHLSLGSEEALNV